MAITDLLTPVTSSATARPITDTLAAPGYTHGATSATLAAGTNWADGVVYFSIYTTTTIGSTTVKDPTTQTDWKATKSGTALTNMILTGGSATKDYTTGAIVELTPTSRWAYDQYQWATAHGNLDGTLKASAIQSALGLGSASLNGWNPLGFTFNSVTYLGNRSYSCVVTGQDVTGTLSAGMRVRTQRTVAAPTQSSSLNGTTQYWSRASASLGSTMTFTNNFVVSAWVKLSSYSGAIQTIASRYNGTSGWRLQIYSSGQVALDGFNAGAANFAESISYQSLPLNKWVHVTAQMDMSTTSVGTTNNYIMFDGVEVPNSFSRGGTNPTTLVQAGNLEIGSQNGGALPWNGKIAQVAIYSAKVTQATIAATISQTIPNGTTSLISAYDFNGNANDINVTSANNLTANGSVTATAADSPFGGQAGGTISSTLDYGIVQSATFSTNTTVVVQVPEGCTIPTSGGVSAVSYATVKAPYGMPVQDGKFDVQMLVINNISTSGTVSGTVYNPGGLNLNTPIGAWSLEGDLGATVSYTTANADLYMGLSTSTSTFSDPEMTSRFFNSGYSTGPQIITSMRFRKPINLAAATPYYALLRPNTAFSSAQLRGDNSATNSGEHSTITARNAYL